MINESRILDYVIEILKASRSPLAAREICYNLLKKGVTIEKSALNQILWSRNNRLGLLVDKQTFKWRYDPDVAMTVETEKTKQLEWEYRQILTDHGVSNSFCNALEHIGFEFIGVWRERTEKPFFFLKEYDDCYKVVNHTGNIMHERANICSRPESLEPTEFSGEQIKKAVNETLEEHRKKNIDLVKDIINALRDPSGSLQVI